MALAEVGLSTVYGGGEYVGRTWYGTKPGGFGASRLRFATVQQHRLRHRNAADGSRQRLSFRAHWASCVGQTKSIVEGTTGFWYKPYNGPKGRLQIGLQYSYLVRTAWVGYGGIFRDDPSGPQPGFGDPGSEGHREHVVHVVPLLPAVRSCVVRFSITGRSGNPAALFASPTSGLRERLHLFEPAEERR